MLIQIFYFALINGAILSTVEYCMKSCAIIKKLLMQNITQNVAEQLSYIRFIINWIQGNYNYNTTIVGRYSI